eukprot:g38053.t1
MGWELIKEEGKFVVNTWTEIGGEKTKLGVFDTTKQAIHALHQHDPTVSTVSCVDHAPTPEGYVDPV